MSWQGRSTYKPRPRGNVQFPELIGLMLISALTFHQPSDEEPQEEKPPTESQDSTHGQEREEDQDAAEIQMPDVEADLKDLSQSKTGDEWGDGTDVQGKILQKPYQFKMPESDILSIKMQNYVLSVFHNIIILIIQRENITAPLKTESRVQMQTYFER
ncbi:PREDICTED: X antigen family member 3-like [Colobus angolensis palliatus]|uniref:X antigen family member 3-like n=1 Tax=Colobus angolensis palliatus TaxID=336983 RepID=UPI0005F45C9F|nr:PREDICTED: X antigen family member 3-like [Colobus angolensis palliatus]